MYPRARIASLLAGQPVDITLCNAIGRAVQGRTLRLAPQTGAARPGAREAAGAARSTRSELTSKRGANMAPKRASRGDPDRGISPGQDGCAARDSNPEPAD